MTKPFIFFDLGMVMLHYDFQLAMNSITALTGIDGKAILDDMYYNHQDLIYGIEDGSVSTETFFQAMMNLHGITNATMPELIEAYNDIFTPIPGMAELVEHLHQAGYRLGILSNTCEAHWTYCQQKYADLFSNFDVLCASHELGAAKPDLKIYAKAAQCAGVPATEIVFIDDRADNIAGARAAGFDGIRFLGLDDLKEQLNRRGIEC